MRVVRQEHSVNMELKKVLLVSADQGGQGSR